MFFLCFKYINNCVYPFFQTALSLKPVANEDFKQATYTGIYNMRVHYADPNECRIHGADFLPTGELIVCDRANQTLKLWSSTFQYLAHYVLPGEYFVVLYLNGSFTFHVQNLLTQKVNGYKSRSRSKGSVTFKPFR